MPISVREFKAHLSRYLADARAGRPVVITSHRKVIARVVGVADPAESGPARLVALGIAHWEAAGKPAGDAVELQQPDPLVSQVVGEQRG